MQSVPNYHRRAWRLVQRALGIKSSASQQMAIKGLAHFCAECTFYTPPLYRTSIEAMVDQRVAPCALCLDLCRRGRTIRLFRGEELYAKTVDRSWF